MKRVKTKGAMQRTKRAGLSRFDEIRLRRKLRRIAPSEPWVDAQFSGIVETGSEESTVIRIHNPHVFPPGGAQTKMKRCPKCGVMTPPNAFEGGVCLDHREDGKWGRSPSAMAIAALQHMNLRLTDSPLPSESTAALRAEIARFENKSLRKRGKGKKMVKN